MGRRRQVNMPKVRFNGKHRCGTNGIPVKTTRAAYKKKYNKAYDAAHPELKLKRVAVRKAKPFHFQGKSYGLTYSQASSIVDCLELFTWLQAHLGIHRCTVSQEHHSEPIADGSFPVHYHVSGKLDRVLRIESADHFDYTTADMLKWHPNIIAGGPAWETYVRKGGVFHTNIPERPNHYAIALQEGTTTAALNYLMEHDASSYVRFAVSLEANLSRHFRRIRCNELPRFAGPYPASRYPTNWNPLTHSLHLWGPPGGGKTCYAQHLLREMFGVSDFCKGHVESLKSISFLHAFCFDEVMLLAEPAATSRELADVVSGGTIHARYSPIYIPPGVPRIFTSNTRWVFKNPEEAVYGRRLIQMEFPLVAPIRHDPPPDPPPPAPPTTTPPSSPRRPPGPPPMPDFDPDPEYPEVDAPQPQPVTPSYGWLRIGDRWRLDEHAPVPLDVDHVNRPISPDSTDAWDPLLPFSDYEPDRDPFAEFDVETLSF